MSQNVKNSEQKSGRLKKVGISFELELLKKLDEYAEQKFKGAHICMHAYHTRFL